MVLLARETSFDVCYAQCAERRMSNSLLLLVLWDAAISGTACPAGPGCHGRADPRWQTRSSLGGGFRRNGGASGPEAQK